MRGADEVPSECILFDVSTALVTTSMLQTQENDEAFPWSIYGCLKIELQFLPPKVYSLKLLLQNSLNLLRCSIVCSDLPPYPAMDTVNLPLCTIFT